MSAVRWLRKWSYLLLLTGAGVLYMMCVDKWHIYGESLAKAEEWYAASRPGAGDFGSGGGKENGAENGLPEIVTDDLSAGMTGSESFIGQGGEEGTSGGMSGTGQTEGDGTSEGESSAGQTGELGDSGNESSAGQTGGDGSAEQNPTHGQPEGGTAGEGTSSGQPEGSGNETFPEGTGSEGGVIGGEPVYTTVEDDYFADAVFIGDSRTVGLYEYAGLEETAAFYASTGLTVYKMFDAEIVSVPGQRKKISVEEALGQYSFAKIYLMIGINEMGTGTVESFLAKYQEAVEHLQELQPDAIIYLQAIIKVSTERSQQGDYINNDGIVARNEGIAQMADNVKVFYLDVNPLICDETGGLTASYTFDGVHLKAKYIDIWKDYLKSHAILLD